MPFSPDAISPFRGFHFVCLHFQNAAQRRVVGSSSSRRRRATLHRPGSHLHQMLNVSADVDSSSPNFWILVAALKVEFIENEGAGEPPLEGSIPDMTSLTEINITIRKHKDNTGMT
ncbi:hypothetical protein Taro_012186, partial [Colocasia esculenta]|nr:hypothetical protein [Colocasia esculenta]